MMVLSMITYAVSDSVGMIHASCEDYRAAASIDLKHDEADLNKQIQCPLLVLWGEHGMMDKHFDMLSIWQNRSIMSAVKPSIACIS